MTNINKFSIKRTALLMKKSVYEKKSNILKGFYILFGVFSVGYFFSNLENSNPENVFFNFYYLGLFIMGMAAAGMAFDNFRTKEKTMSYLSIPASNIEKYLAEFIVTSLGFVVAYTAVFYIFNILAVLASRYYGIDAHIINITEKHNNFLNWFLIMHSVFFAGAATFKKAPRISTGFTIFLSAIVLIAYAGFWSWLLFHNLPENNSQIDKTFFMDSLWLEIGKFTLNYITAPILWLFAFFKVKEKTC